MQNSNQKKPYVAPTLTSVEPTPDIVAKFKALQETAAANDDNCEQPLPPREEVVAAVIRGIVDTSLLSAVIAPESLNASTNLNQGLGEEAPCLIDLLFDLEGVYGIEEISDDLFDETSTIGSIADAILKRMAGEPVDIGETLGTLFDLDDVEYYTVERSAYDIEFFVGPTGERARVRRLLVRWADIDFNSVTLTGSRRLHYVLNLDDPQIARQQYMMEQLCQDGRWRTVAVRPDLDFVKSVAERWVQTGGEINDFYEDWVKNKLN